MSVTLTSSGVRRSLEIVSCKARHGYAQDGWKQMMQHQETERELQLSVQLAPD